MRILLVQPSQRNVYGANILPAYPPLGLLFIGSVLQNMGHQVKLIDVDIDNVTDSIIESSLKEFDPDLLGLNAVTPTYNNAVHIAKIAKRIKKDIFVVLGGIHATIDSEMAISPDEINFLVVGEGEETVKEFVSILEKGGNDFDGVKGLWYKKDGQVFKNKGRELIEDLDTIPFPAYNLLTNIHKYMPPDALNLPVASIITTRGCVAACTFCCTKQIFGGRKIRARSVKNVVEEIKRLVEDYGVKEIHVMDDIFTYHKKRVLEFCNEISKLPYKLQFVFSNGIRADQVDEEILYNLKKIGLRYVMHGIESANEQILKNVKKGIKINKVKEAYKIAKKLKLETWACFIIGLPGETDDTVRESINLAKELDPDFVKFFILKPYPGSEIYNELFNKGLILETNYDNYGLYTKPIHTLPGMTAERMHYWQKRATREFYLRPGKIFSHLKRIKTWKQVLLNLNALKLMLKIMK